MGALMRGMAQLQSAMTESLASRSKDEVVKPGQNELPKLPDLSTNSAIDVGDWLHGLQNHMGDLSGNSGMWWKEVLSCLSRYYEAYLSASHVGKLSLRSADYETDFLKDARWLRLDKRAASMILASIPEAVKSDILAARLAGTLPMLARIVVLYRPGSVAERQQILQALESPTAARSSTEAVNELRKWSRWMARALDMGLQPPDPSVLIKGLDGMTKSVLNDHSDVAFRISMLRYNLEVDTRPTIKGAQDLQQALLSELEQVAFRTRPGGSAAATVKAVTLPSPPPPAKAPQPTGGGDGSPRKQKPPCKFYLTEKGCSKGGACSFSHNFTRKERAGRCWTCGSTLHQQTACPTKQDGGSPTAKSKASAPKAPAQPQVAAVLTEPPPAPLPSTSATGPAASTASSSASTAPTTSTLPEGDLKDLLKEASAMLKEIRQLKMLSLSQVEKCARELGCDPIEGRTGLLDSGASHPYREATNEELDAAHRVQVQLADGREVCLAQNASGTLLVQASRSGASSGPIVPLGALVQDLGCQVSWTRRGGLTIRHPEHGIIKPTMVGRCPVVAETQALDLIYEIECEKLRELRAATKASAKSLWMWATDKPWAQHLEAFVREGGRAHQLQAMGAMGSPFLGWSELDKSLISESIDLGDKAGWIYLRALPGSRQRRKRLMSMPWVVHLFSGPGHAVDPLFRELDDGRVLVQIDINRSKSEDLSMIAGAYRCLLWGAATGRVDGFFGSPPVKPELVQKMMWLVTVAKAARAERGGHPVFAMFEGEKMMKLLRGTDVEKWKAVVGSWEKFVEATCLEEIGENVVTNLAFDGIPPVANERGSSRWTPEFKEALVQAVRLWGREPEALQVAKWVKKLDIKDGDFMESLSDKELAMWRAHVRNNHLPYNRRCQTCVRSSGTGKIHRRIKHPGAYCLSLDVAGPFRHKAADPNHKDYRYLLVGAYIMPKQSDEPQVPQADEPQVPQADEPQVPQAGGLIDMFDDLGLDVCDDDRGVGPVLLDDEPDPMEESPERRERGGVEDGDELRGLSQEEFERIYREVGTEMEFVTVYLVRPMRTRTSAEVTAAVQELILRLKSEGLHVSRVHSDRARELRVQPLRRWLLEHGILVTYTEGQAPQSNGRAEAAVKWTKSSVKRLLSAAKLGNENWAVAANYATQERFERMLKGSSSMLPFGTKVHVRSKVYGTGGRYDLDSRWKAGQYVGPSLEVRGGHVIRFDNGAFMTSTHLRPYLVDSDQIVDLEEYEVRLPNPERRLRAKTKAEAATEHDGQEVNTTIDPDHPAELYAKDLLEEEVLYAEQMETLAMMLPTTTATPKRFGPQARTQKVWMAGAFVHGGIAGVKNATTSFPHSTRVFVRYVKKLEPTHKFNSLAVTVDTEAKQHVDAHNVGMNLIAGLSWFKGGGVEVEEPDGVKLLELDGVNTHQVFNPKYRHSTRPWSGGSRVVLVAYSVRDSGKLPQDKIDLLHNFGFEWEPHLSKPPVVGEVPRIGAIKVGLLETGSHAVAPEQPRDSSDQVAEDFNTDAVAPEQHRDSSDQVGDVPYEDQFRKQSDTDVLSHLSQDLEIAIQDLEDRAARLRDLLEEEEILNEEYRRLGDSTRAYLMDARDQVGTFLDNVHEELVQAERAKSAMFLCAMKAGQEPTPEEDIDYESLLDGLEEDLKVVHTVPTSQVRRALDRWSAAIRKEVEALFASGTLRRATIEEARALEAEHKVTFAPAKCIFTLKPPQTPGLRARRKCRLVICGNYIRDNSDFGDLYAAGTSTDALRLSLVLAAIKVWVGAISDITGAFLLAEWPEGLPKYGFYPPRLVRDAGLATNEAWIVERPLYGLRESPRIWCDFRNRRLRTARVRCGDLILILRPTISESELWMILDEITGVLCGLVVLYVDDIAYFSTAEIIKALHAFVTEEWPASPLEWIGEGPPARYLGMEIRREPRTTSGGAAFFVYTIGQAGYVQDLLRGHDMENVTPTALPVPREWVEEAENDDSVESDIDEATLKHAQRIVGEALWLSTRTRPDLSFVVGHAASLVARRPSYVTRLGQRLMAYLAGTKDLRMTMGPSTPTTVPELVAFTDASYAPFGRRSFGAAVITLAGAPVAWKSGKQSFITLSVMEAELYAATQGCTLLNSVHALLSEVWPGIQRVLAVDNTSAASMLSGGPGSQRTRHLKIRASYVREAVENGDLIIRHTPGAVQLADLATKMQPKLRLHQLLQLWGFVGFAQDTVREFKLKVLAFFMVIAQCICPTRAVKDEDKEPLPHAGWDELLLVCLASALIAVLIWEVGRCVYRRVKRSIKRMNKARKLNEVAKFAAEAARQEIAKEEAGSRIRHRASRKVPAPENFDYEDLFEEGMRATTTRTRTPTTRTAEPPQERATTPSRPSTASSSSQTRPTTPPPRTARSEVFTVSPQTFSEPSEEERWRVCFDVLRLMVCEDLKTALRLESKPLSGLKDDMIGRLQPVLYGSTSTTRQLKYVLYLWRHKSLDYRCRLVWHDINEKGRISSWIARWKDV